MTAEKLGIAGTINQLDGNVTLIDFRLEEMQLAVAKGIILSYCKKLKEVSNCKGLKIRLRQHEHGKRFLYEVKTESIITEEKGSGRKSGKGKNIRLNATVTSYDLYAALAEVLEKIFSEASHKSRTTKQAGLIIKKPRNNKQSK